MILQVKKQKEGATDKVFTSRPAPTIPINWEEKERTTMEYLTGVTKKEALEISEILAGDYEGRQIKVRGAIHTIRDIDRKSVV